MSAGRVMSADLVTRRVADLLRAPHEHDGQRVVTLAEVDRVHGRKRGTARDTFRRVKRRLTEGKHFFRVDRTTVLGVDGGPDGRGSHPRPSQTRGLKRGSDEIVLLTEPGYLLLVKPFNDDLSWQIQEHLVESYFRARALAAGDDVLVSRAELERARREAEDGARMQVRLARWLRGHVSQGARDMSMWRRLGSSGRALANEHEDQVRIPGVDFRAVVQDLSASAPRQAESADVDLIGVLGQLVEQAVGRALAGRSA